MSKIKVTFHRTYEIEENVVLDRLDDYEDLDGNKLYKEDYIFSDDEIKEEAEQIALNLLSEEIPYFESNPNDFVSSTIEIIK